MVGLHVITTHGFLCSEIRSTFHTNTGKSDNIWLVWILMTLSSKIMSLLSQQGFMRVMENHFSWRKIGTTTKRMHQSHYNAVHPQTHALFEKSVPCVTQMSPRNFGIKKLRLTGDMFDLVPQKCKEQTIYNDSFEIWIAIWCAYDFPYPVEKKQLTIYTI